MIHCKPSKQKLSTKSSTESEVSVPETTSLPPFRLKQNIEAQGYGTKNNNFNQDNSSGVKLK